MFAKGSSFSAPTGMSAECANKVLQCLGGKAGSSKRLGRLKLEHGHQGRESQAAILVPQAIGQRRQVAVGLREQCGRANVSQDLGGSVGARVTTILGPSDIPDAFARLFD